MRYVIREKFFHLGEDSQITDENGRPVYEVDGKVLSLHNTLVMRNMSGQEVATIKRHLKTFAWRFFKTSQFKRSCVPNAPKVGSGGSLSPRGDWRAPSDAAATLWLAELDNVPDCD